METEARNKINVFFRFHLILYNRAGAVTITAIIKYINENNSIFIFEGKDENDMNKKKATFPISNSINYFTDETSTHSEMSI